MKFITLASIFAAFSVAAVGADNLRSTNFLDAKPADEHCEDGTWDCTCRDGTSCKTTEKCTKLGVGGSCARRLPQSNRSGNLSCRNGEDCIDNNTACEDGSKCKDRTETAESYRNLVEGDSELIMAKPASEACQNGDLRCTCRDGTNCRRTQQCVNRNVSGSCSFRRRNRNTNMSCRNGESCINGNTACRDGSKCKERNNDFLSFARNLDENASFLEAKPADERCENGTWYCTCRDGTRCRFTDQCIRRGASGSCARRIENDRNSRFSCRNGEKCINGNTACEDGSKCKDRTGYFVSE